MNPVTKSGRTFGFELQRMTHSDYQKIKVDAISGRYLPPGKCMAEVRRYATQFREGVLGHSVQGEPIISLRGGQGKTRVLMWSQMHGNESTTTKAVLDLLSYFDSGNGSELLKQLEIMILPMLNPDGSQAYTRENAAGKDLNREAMERSQPESKALDKAYQEFQPDYCFNLHDQRSIYSVGGTAKSASLSFLAPSMDEERSVSDHRRTAMQLIAAIQGKLPKDLQGNIGRYDDSFNPNCVGDRFQMAGSASILFEAGHVPGDYERETSRYYVFCAILSALREIATEAFKGVKTEGYFHIPDNTKEFVDILIHHPSALGDKFAGEEKLLIQYEEVLEDGRVHLKPAFAEEGLSSGKYGHLELDASQASDLSVIKSTPGLSALLF